MFVAVDELEDDLVADSSVSDLDTVLGISVIALTLASCSWDNGQTV